MSERFAHYKRDSDVEELFGSPDHEMWRLYESALKTSDKNALVRAMHIVMAAAGRDIAYARGTINTYTLALYLMDDSGEFTSDAFKNPRSYSEPSVYGFIYGTGQEYKAEPHMRRKQLDVTEGVLDSAWATRLMDREDAEVESVVEKIHQLKGESAR